MPNIPEINRYERYLETFASLEPAAGNVTNDRPNARQSSQGGYLSNFDPNVSVRPPMVRQDYEFFRPNEAIPMGNNQEELRRIMVMCNNAYERIGVIRSVIDLMSEFTIKGIEIVHEDEGPNKFYHAWQKRVKLEDRAERFASYFYRMGQTAVRRKFGQLDKSEIKKMRRTDGADLSNNEGLGRIPLEYVFYNPATLEVVGGVLSSLSSNKIYALRLPIMNLTSFAVPKTPLEQKAFDGLPQEIKDAILNKTQKITGSHYLLKIPEDKLYVAYYKKDDTDIWAKSFIYSILRDVFYNDKVHLAKTATLDSWTNIIRLWKIGDAKNNVYMSPAQRARLASILQHNTGGGGMDIIWGDDLQLEEFYPPIEKLSNFEENYNGILMGLGISDSLVGGETGTTGQGGNVIGLKNLVTRIACGRRAIKDWIESEIDIIQKNMGFKKRPFVRFTYEDLHDERTYFNLLVQLLDRNVISDKTVLERINEIPDVEAQRISDEEKARGSDAKPEKASPFHNPTLPEQRTHEIKKLKLQEELKQAGNPATRTDNLTKLKNNKKSPNGRPPGSKDMVKRTRSPNKVRSPVAKVILSAENIYDSISELLTAELLLDANVKDVRSLNSEQKNKLDQAKVYIFSKISPFSEITPEVITACLNEDNDNYTIFTNLYNKSLSEAAIEKLTEDQKRTLRIQVYINLWCINKEEDEDDENISD